MWSLFYFVPTQVEASNRCLKQELESKNGGPHVYLLKEVNDLENLPILDLKQIFNQLKIDLDKVEKVSDIIFNRVWVAIRLAEYVHRNYYPWFTCFESWIKLRKNLTGVQIKT